MSSVILDRQIVELGFGLDIDDIPTSQMEKQHQFCCKCPGTVPKIDQGSFLAFANFYGSQKEYTKQKVARVKGLRKRKVRGKKQN